MKELTKTLNACVDDRSDFDQLRQAAAKFAAWAVNYLAVDTCKLGLAVSQSIVEFTAAFNEEA